MATATHTHPSSQSVLADIQALDEQMNSLRLGVRDPLEAINSAPGLTYGRTDIFKVEALLKQRTDDRLQREAMFEQLKRDAGAVVQKLTECVTAITVERDTLQAQLIDASKEMEGIKASNAAMKVSHGRELQKLQAQLDMARRGQADMKAKAEKDARASALALQSLTTDKTRLEAQLAVVVKDRDLNLQAKTALETAASDVATQKMYQAGQTLKLENRLIRADGEVTRLSGVVAKLRKDLKDQLAEARANHDFELVRLKAQCEDLLQTVIDLTNRADNDAIAHENEVKQLKEGMEAVRAHYNAILVDIGDQLGDALLLRSNEPDHYLVDYKAELARTLAQLQASTAICEEQAKEIEQLKQDRLSARGSPSRLLRRACEDSAKPATPGSKGSRVHGNPNSKL
ncbi:hypothetical protein FRB94_011128 [Tulasnella sp. JGI-2019a]|nr:hypothetical protein FRB94_011128 [Tulasnella sp. JGI-2019a]